MKKFLTSFLIVLMLSANAYAGADGENELSKKNNVVKDCFEPLNRVTFAVNMGLDKVVFKPVAKAYRALPSPIRSGTKGVEFIKIFENKILEPLDKFKPEVIFISAGFDAHIRDPLANINLESSDYFKITKKILELANIHSSGRIISFFEGGYDLQALSESVQEHLIALK